MPVAPPAAADTPRLMFQYDGVARMNRKRRCMNCGGGVYAQPPAEKLDLCEPCYWAWQDLGKPKRYLPLDLKKAKKLYAAKKASERTSTNNIPHAEIGSPMYGA